MLQNFRERYSKHLGLQRSIYRWLMITWYYSYDYCVADFLTKAYFMMYSIDKSIRSHGLNLRFFFYTLINAATICFLYELCNGVYAWWESLFIIIWAVIILLFDESGILVQGFIHKILQTECIRPLWDARLNTKNSSNRRYRKP